MRLLTDENIQHPTVEHLRALGHDVRSVAEEGLRALPRTRRSLRTPRSTGARSYNLDFADIRELAGKEHHGIIRLRIRDQRVSSMHPILDAALQQIQDMDLLHALVTISDHRIRIRHTLAP